MKYGLFTFPYQRLSLEKIFSDARVLGYDYIELRGGQPHAYPPDLLGGDPDAVLRLIDCFGMPVEIYTPEYNIRSRFSGHPEDRGEMTES